MAYQKEGDNMTKPASLFRPKAKEDVSPASSEKKSLKKGKHLISGLFDEAAYRQFTVLAAELGLHRRELLREALNDLFIKHGKPPIT
jgi:hypothetical protein